MTRSSASQSGTNRLQSYEVKNSSLTMLIPFLNALHRRSMMHVLYNDQTQSLLEARP